MTRRSLLKTLAGAVAALAIPAAVRRRTEAAIAQEEETNKVIRYEFRNGEFHEVDQHLECELNPAWVNAPYEALVYHHRDILKIQFS